MTDPENLEGFNTNGSRSPERLQVLENAGSFAAMADQLSAPEAPTHLYYNPQAVGEEGEPKRFLLDKEAMRHCREEIRQAIIGEEHEIESDLRIVTAINNISALLRGEQIEQSKEESI